MSEMQQIDDTITELSVSRSRLGRQPRRGSDAYGPTDLKHISDIARSNQ
jgi:hypothetical protein